jgi:hypothetical protein
MKHRRQLNGSLQAATAFTMGATLGSLFALLYAPTSGHATRRRIALKVRQLERTAARRIGVTQRLLARRAAEVREATAGWIAKYGPPAANGRSLRRRRRLQHAVVHYARRRFQQETAASAAAVFVCYNHFNETYDGSADW